MRCQVSGADSSSRAGQLATQQDHVPTDLTESSRALLYGEADEEAPETVTLPEETGLPQPSRQPWVAAVLAALSLSALVVAGIFLWYTLRVDPGEPAAPETELTEPASPPEE